MKVCWLEFHIGLSSWLNCWTSWHRWWLLLLLHDWLSVREHRGQWNWEVDWWGRLLCDQAGYLWERMHRAKGVAAAQARLLLNLRTCKVDSALWALYTALMRGWGKTGTHKSGVLVKIRKLSFRWIWSLPVRSTSGLWERNGLPAHLQLNLPLRAGYPVKQYIPLTRKSLYPLEYRQNDLPKVIGVSALLVPWQGSRIRIKDSFWEWNMSQNDLVNV